MKRALFLALSLAAPLHAQTAGTTGAQVLQFNAGARAAALSGAYSAVRADADALFYNPAGIADASRGASFGYETYATDVAFGSGAGFTRLGRVSVGLSMAYLDAGKIAEVVPSDEFGGNTGTATGASASASETAARVSFALPLRQGQLRIGVSGGLVSSSVAELSQHAPMADVGLQYDVGKMTVAASVRNFGGSLSGSHAPLPTEARLGAMLPFALSGGWRVNAFADLIARVRESAFSFATGLEAGIAPGSRDLGAVARVGFDTSPNQLSSLHFGAGLTRHAISVDYAFQNLDFVGAVHRLGVRWTVR